MSARLFKHFSKSVAENIIFSSFTMKEEGLCKIVHAAGMGQGAVKFHIPFGILCFSLVCERIKSSPRFFLQSIAKHGKNHKFFNCLVRIHIAWGRVAHGEQAYM